MKAVARLVYSYFTSSRMAKALTLAGLASCLASAYMVVTLPQSAHMLTFAFAGIISLFVGSSMMPLIFGRLAQGHAACILPGVRIKLLASAIITVLLVALPVGMLTPFAFVAGVSGKISDLATQPQLVDYMLNLALTTYTSACILAAWIYVLIWFLTSQRNMVGFTKGMVVVLALMFVPAREIRELSVTTLANLLQMAAFALVFGTGFLLWPRIKARFSSLRRARAAMAHNPTVCVVSGKEIDLMLGTANPWLLVVGQVVPIVIAVRIGHTTPDVWIFYLTMLSTVAGAISGQAAVRSRALWLRGNWSRAALFSTVERSFWRHNGLVMGVLIVAMFAVGAYAGVATRLLVTGLPLVMLGTVLSTYLGLMVTRSVGWLEGALGAVIMLSLMAVALLVTQQADRTLLMSGIVIALAAIALVLRQLAMRRWRNIDWMLCRAEQPTGFSRA
jgi:hypothetical protein